MQLITVEQAVEAVQSFLDRSKGQQVYPSAPYWVGRIVDALRALPPAEPSEDDIESAGAVRTATVVGVEPLEFRIRLSGWKVPRFRLRGFQYRNSFMVSKQDILSKVQTPVRMGTKLLVRAVPTALNAGDLQLIGWRPAAR